VELKQEVTDIMKSFISATVHWILKEEGMAWTCSMDGKQEKCKKYMHFSQKT
jgi:hypothetical protein